MKEKKKINTIRKIEYKNKESFFLIIRGLEVGIVAGLVAVFYRFLLEYAEKYLNIIISTVKDSPSKIALWFIALAALGGFVAMLNKIEPMSSGSGIPQVAGEVKGVLTQNWWRVLLAKIVGGTVCVFSGLSLGREGPSVQLGGMAAKGIARATKADKTTELRMISCGAGGGVQCSSCRHNVCFGGNSPFARQKYSLYGYCLHNYCRLCVKTFLRSKHYF